MSPFPLPDAMANTDDKRHEKLGPTVTKRHETFDLDVLQLAKSAEFTNERNDFINFPRFLNSVCHLKTKFHIKFCEDIENLRIYGERQSSICGIKGIGKTTSLIYNLLEHVSKKCDCDMHYFDLKRIVVRDENLEKFRLYANKIGQNHCVLLDHVTIFNHDTVQKMKSIVKDDVKMILIETGFTASSNSHSHGYKNDQLDKEDFMALWLETLRNFKSRHCEKDIESLAMRGEEVYARFSRSFIMTPGLLQFVWRSMYIEGHSLLDTFLRFKKKMEKSIQEFSVIDDDSNLFSKFILHTRFLLHFLPKDGAYVLKLEQFEKLKVAINIFDTSVKTVTKNEGIIDLDVEELGLEDGDEYVVIRHLVPEVAEYWREKLPCNWESVIDMVDFNQLLRIMFQNGGPRKAVVKLIVKFQENNDVVIVPYFFKCTTSVYTPACSECRLPQAKQIAFLYGKVQFFTLNLDSLTHFQTVFTGHEKNVAKCAMWIKHRNSTDSFLLYPKEPTNLMGIDYFVYFIEDDLRSPDGCPSPKQPKKKHIIFLVQVATSQSHGGETIGRAFNIVQNVFADVDIIIHAVIICARKQEDYYLLTKCQFEHVTVINLANAENLKAISRGGDSNLLHKFLMKLGS